MENNAFKSGFVTLIGRPNVGKSTLMNCIIGQKIAITSNKPQTTRNRIQTVYTSEEGQIVFLDTPGIHKAKNKLGDYMVTVAEKTLSEVDVILWLVEPSNFIGAGERHIIEQLKKGKTPVILVINKIDTVKKEQLLEYIDTYRKEYDFAEIVPVSALKAENIKELLKCIMKYLPYGPAFYDEDTVTDQPVRQIVAELIREKTLRLLSDEIPHGVAVSIESMKYKKNIVDIEATIFCERDSHKGIIIGKNGAMLKKIGSMARRDIEDLLEKQANLQLWVKVKKDWRDGGGISKTIGVTVTKKPEPPKPAKKPTTSTSNGKDGILRVGDTATLSGRYYYDSWGKRPAGSKYSGVQNGVKVDSYSSSDFGGNAKRTGNYKVHIGGADGVYKDLGWVRHILDILFDSICLVFHFIFRI